MGRSTSLDKERLEELFGAATDDSPWWGSAAESYTLLTEEFPIINYDHLKLYPSFQVLLGQQTGSQLQVTAGHNL